MSADIADTAASAGFGRVSPPGGLFLVAIFKFSCQPALRVLNNHLTDFAELTFVDHFPGFLDHGIASIIVGQAIKSTRCFDGLGQLFSLSQVETGGLI